MKADYRAQLILSAIRVKKETTGMFVWIGKRKAKIIDVKVETFPDGMPVMVYITEGDFPKFIPGSSDATSVRIGTEEDYRRYQAYQKPAK